ncbi:magnesium transporter [Alkalilimnicola sp. S0819]|uniref:magnesium transporter n=1 Tax=Alkalilimnicola sp. S0819 TaxID=2613922 RepID=UPI0012622440|nr:magnesium transporter [Alkalilimnicola sp. S0819]KAB7623815.1 magnesium transporter [Alkalilimnicola sp. S0819]MPQ16689.1 magnesium transporter [Alkalilimnicola sp. S0819]
MQQTAKQEKPLSLIQALAEALESGTVQRARAMLNALHPAEIAHLLESFPPAQRKLLWELVDPEYDGEVLLHVNDDLRNVIIGDMDPKELIAATEGMDMDDLADFLQDLPATLIGEVLQSMDKQNRQRLEAVMSYPEDSAGGLMNTDTITVRADVSLDVVLRYLRLRGEIPELTDKLIVVNRYDRYVGILPLSQLLTNDPNLSVAKVLDASLEPIQADSSATEVAKLFQDRDLVSAPVVDEQGQLLGRITIDDVVDVIRDEAERSLMHMAGLDEETDMFAPIFTNARRRAVWLGISLISALTAASVVNIFEATIQQIVALAVLMPIVASMGGIAGQQTLTVVIRGLALGQIGSANARSLILRETAVGVLNGMLWAAVIGAVAATWFHNPRIGLIIGCAMVINLFFGAFAGSIIPLFLRKVGVDPALAGGMMLTTVTDVIGFMAFLGLATIFLL